MFYQRLHPRGSVDQKATHGANRARSLFHGPNKLYVSMVTVAPPRRMRAGGGKINNMQWFSNGDRSKITSLILNFEFLPNGTFFHRHV